MWQITKGQFGKTKLDGSRFALYYAFPGLVEQGNGVARAYVDSAATPAQRKALEAIGTGNAGGGIFELFAKQLTRKWLPTKTVPIAFELKDGVGRFRIGGLAQAESGLLSYPDGTVIRPMMELPHGIEFKKALMTNAKSWWWRDEELLATHLNRYGAACTVRFNQAGCIA